MVNDECSYCNYTKSILPIEIRVTTKLRHIHTGYPAQKWNSEETLEPQLFYVHFLQHDKV